MRFAFIDRHRRDWPVRLMCRVLEVTAGGFYAWLGREPGVRQRRHDELAAQITTVHAANRRVYGSPRVHRALVAQGESVSENTVAKLMRDLDLRGKSKKRFVPRTTEHDPAATPASNVLDRGFAAEAPNRKWVADITYVPTDEGWLYLAVVIDLFSRRVVGWSMADHLRTELVRDAMAMALTHRGVGSGGSGDSGGVALLHHSDRGSQYTSDAYRGLLEAHGVQPSMSRRGNCYDNAVAESFFATLKGELVHHEHYATHAQARASIFEYIEVFYNRQRLHSTLGYRSPEAFEAALN
jgi:transposase InsO family protein